MGKVVETSLIVLALALPAGTCAAGTLYVQSAKAKLLAAPSFGAAVVTQISRGDALTTLETQDRWYKVKAGESVGWIPRLVVSDHAPLSKATALEAADVELGARRRASVATTAGAARGLTAEDRSRASNAGVANYSSLERVEQFSVSEQEALAFVAAGLKE